MKQPYEAPFIIKLRTSLMNKYGFSGRFQRRVRKTIDDAKVAELVERFGSPLFVYSEHTIRHTYRQFYSAFSTRYPRVAFAWSYKTNYLKAICAIMQDEGARAEVVSKMEYEKAKALGVAGEHVVLNGPYKPIEILEAAGAEGALINVDHLGELEDLELVADRLGHPLRIGLRINLDAGVYPQWSRFGFNLESGEAMGAVRRIAKSERLRLSGLHCHLGTFILDPTAYARSVEKMVKFGYDVQEAFGFRMEYLDIGGGFPSRNKLKGIHFTPDVGLSSLDSYAEHICDGLHNSLRGDDRPLLIVESGRALIDEAGYLIASVLSWKRLADGTRAYVVDAGINLLFTSFWYKYNVELDRDISGPRETSVVYGPLCMNIDAIDEGVELPALERGHRLIFSPVGAYNNTQWLQFIEYRPNVVLVTEDGRVELIRQAEDLSDIERREILPEGLIRNSSEAVGGAGA